MIRVVVTDDHPRLRQALSFILSRNPGISVVAECSDGEEAFRAASQHRPDVILMDINMQPVNGITATERISKTIPGVRIVCMSMHNDISFVNRMLRAGACGYLTKNTSVNEIVMAIEMAHSGKEYICSEIRSAMSK